MIRLPRLAQSGGTAPPTATLHIEGVKQRAIETGRTRLIVTGAIFLLAFSVIAGRMIDVTVLHRAARRAPIWPGAEEPAAGRADIVDRNGVLLATSLPTVSLYAHPHEMRDQARGGARSPRCCPTSPSRTSRPSSPGTAPSSISAQPDAAPGIRRQRARHSRPLFREGRKARLSAGRTGRPTRSD